MAAVTNGVTLCFLGLTLQVSLNYAWRKVHWPHISDHGTHIFVLCVSVAAWVHVI